MLLSQIRIVSKQREEERQQKEEDIENENPKEPKVPKAEIQQPNVSKAEPIIKRNSEHEYKNGTLFTVFYSGGIKKTSREYIISSVFNVHSKSKNLMKISHQCMNHTNPYILKVFDISFTEDAFEIVYDSYVIPISKVLEIRPLKDRKQWNDSILNFFGYLNHNNLTCIDCRMKNLFYDPLTKNIKFMNLKIRDRKGYSTISKYTTCPDQYFLPPEELPYLDSSIRKKLYQKYGSKYKSVIFDPFLWDIGILCLCVLYQRNQITLKNEREKEFLSISHFDLKMKHLLNERKITEEQKKEAIPQITINIITEALLEENSFQNFRNRIISPSPIYKEVFEEAKKIFDSYVQIDPSKRVFNSQISDSLIQRPFSQPIEEKKDTNGHYIYSQTDISNKYLFYQLQDIYTNEPKSNVYFESIDFFVQNAYQFIQKSSDIKFYFYACVWLIDRSCRIFANSYYQNIIENLPKQQIKKIMNYSFKIFSAKKGNILSDSIYLHLKDEEPKKYYDYMIQNFELYKNPSLFIQKFNEISVSVIVDKKYLYLNEKLAKTSYILTQKIGEGMNNDVYEVVDENTNQRYASKIYDYRIYQDSILIGKNNVGMNEISFSSILNHPNIVQSRDFIPTDDWFFLMIDLADSTLESVIENISVEDTIKYIYQFGCAYNYLIRNGIFHCDMKHDNMLIRNGNLVLSDFGNMRFRDFYVKKSCSAGILYPPEFVKDEIIPQSKSYEKIYNEYIRSTKYSDDDDEENDNEENDNDESECKDLCSDLWIFSILCIDIIYRKSFLIEQILIDTDKKDQKFQNRLEKKGNAEDHKKSKKIDIDIYYFIDYLSENYFRPPENRENCYSKRKEIISEYFGVLKDLRSQELLYAVCPFLEIIPKRRTILSISDFLKARIFSENGFNYSTDHASEQKVNYVKNNFDKILRLEPNNFLKIKKLIQLIVNVQAEEYKIPYSIVLMTIDYILQFAIIEFEITDNEKFELLGFSLLWIFSNVYRKKNFQKNFPKKFRKDTQLIREIEKYIMKTYIKQKGHVICDSSYHYITENLHYTHIDAEYKRVCDYISKNTQDYIRRSFQQNVKKLFSYQMEDIPDCYSRIVYGKSAEDTYQVKKFSHYRYYAVFDGHGSEYGITSDHAVLYCRENLHTFLRDRIQYISKNDKIGGDKLGDDKIEEVIRDCFYRFDLYMFEIGKKYGCSCTIVFIDDRNEKIYQINLGDSTSSYLFKSGKLISQTVENSPRRQNSRYRSFGDFSLKKMDKEEMILPVKVEPDIKIFNKKDVEYFFLVSDGIFKGIREDQHDEMIAKITNFIETNKGNDDLVTSLIIDINERSTDDKVVVFGYVL